MSPPSLLVKSKNIFKLKQLAEEVVIIAEETKNERK